MPTKHLCGMLAIYIACAFTPLSASADMSPAEIFSGNSPSIVTIGALDKRSGKIGTGFIVSSDGLILTNNHILDENENIFVRSNDNKFYKGRVVDFDDRLDMALVRIDRPGSKPLQLGNSDNVKVGENILAIGNPLGLECTISDGLISAIRKTETGIKLLQISAPISAGSSGGPLFNMKGEVIGITSSAAAGGQNLNFAVPINYAKTFLAKTLNRREAPASGITTYVVGTEDTLYAISRKFGTTMNDLLRLNGMSNGRITAGQKLKVPAQRSPR